MNKWHSPDETIEAQGKEIETLRKQRDESRRYARKYKAELQEAKDRISILTLENLKGSSVLDDKNERIAELEEYLRIIAEQALQRK